MVLPVSKARISAISPRRHLTISAALKKRGPFGGGCLGPGGRRPGGGLNRQLRFRRAAGGNARIYTAIVRAKDVEQLLIFRCAPFAPSKVLIFFDLDHVHLPLLENPSM